MLNFGSVSLHGLIFVVAWIDLGRTFSTTVFREISVLRPPFKYFYYFTETFNTFFALGLISFGEKGLAIMAV